MKAIDPDASSVARGDSAWPTDAVITILREEADEGCLLCSLEDSTDEDWE